MLAPELHDVFPILTSMLDIKSFMRLALASKEMYERCMLDERIRINIEENAVSVRVVDGARTSSFDSTVVTQKNIKKYLEKLRLLRCNVSLRIVSFHGEEIDTAVFTNTTRCLREMGVKKIDKLEIHEKSSIWEEILSFIKDFRVKDVEIGHGLPEEALRSLLLSDLASFSYKGHFNGELLLQVDFKVPQLSLLSMQSSADVFTQILWKIQTGALTKLSVDDKNIPWSQYTSVLSGYGDPLPPERPLLIVADKMAWFLHWDGGVTICKEMDDGTVEIFKCDLADFPGVLRTEEEVHKELAEKRDAVQCLKRHFLSFFDGIHPVPAAHKGRFPKTRPLVCMSDESIHNITCYVLNRDGSMDIYIWNGIGRYGGHFDMETTWPFEIIDHAPLQKIVFDKRIQKRAKNEFQCRTMEDFCSLFNSYRPLSHLHDFKGQLPERRPLVFKLAGDKEDGEYRGVLYADGAFIQYQCEDDAPANVYSKRCHYWNFPSVLITTQILKEIVLKAPLKKFTYCIDFETFRGAFEGMRTISFHAYGSLPDEYPLVFKRTEYDNGHVVDHRWVLFKTGKVKKCEWKNGRATFAKADPKDFPSILTKAFIKNFFKGVKIVTDSDLVVDRDVLNEYLKEFEIRRYKDTRPLSVDDLPLIYKKKERKHTCITPLNDDCDCIEKILNLWFVAEDFTVTRFTWGEKEGRHLVFYESARVKKVPPLLRTTETFDFLLQVTDLAKFPLCWYGSLEDFVSYFEDHRTIDFNHNDDHLTKKRPLVIVKERGQTSLFWFLRKDGELIRCEWMNSYATLRVGSKYDLPETIHRQSVF